MLLPSLSAAMLRPSRLLRGLSALCRASSRAFAAEAAPQEESVLHKVLSAQLSDIRAAGTYKTELELVSPQGPAVSLAGVEGEVLNFCAPLLPRTSMCAAHRAWKPEPKLYLCFTPAKHSACLALRVSPIDSCRKALLLGTRGADAGVGRRQQLPGPEQPPAAGRGRARRAGRAWLWFVIRAIHLWHAGTCLIHCTTWLLCACHAGPSITASCSTVICLNLTQGAGVVFCGRMRTAGWRRS